nr:hypothetical protein CFP56_70743 [Quercus suber]
MEAAMNQVDSRSRELEMRLHRDSAQESREWNVKRDEICQAMSHRKYAEFLNKRIEMYDELAIIVGKDMTIGSFAKSYVDLDLKQENVDDIENVADNGRDGVVDKGKNVVQSSTIGSIISKSRKRSHAPLSDDNVFTDLSGQLRKLLWP